MSSRNKLTYEFLTDAIAEMKALNERGYSKQGIVNAGVYLFSFAPPDLREAALMGDKKRIQKWFSHAFDAWAVSIVEEMKKESEKKRDSKASA